MPDALSASNVIAQATTSDQANYSAAISGKVSHRRPARSPDKRRRASATVSSKVSRRSGPGRPPKSRISGAHTTDLIAKFDEFIAIRGTENPVTRIVAPKLPTWTDLRPHGKAYLAMLEIERKGSAFAITTNVPDTIVERTLSGKDSIREWANREMNELARSVYRKFGIGLEFVLVIETREEGHRKRKADRRQRYDVHGTFNFPGPVRTLALRHFARRLDLRRLGQHDEPVKRRTLVAGKGAVYSDDVIHPILLANKQTGVSIKIKPVYDSYGWGDYCTKGLDKTAGLHDAVAGDHPEIISKALRGEARAAWDERRAIATPSAPSPSERVLKAPGVEMTTSEIELNRLKAIFSEDRDMLTRVFRQARSRPGVTDREAAAQIIAGWWQRRAPELRGL